MRRVVKQEIEKKQKNKRDVTLGGARGVTCQYLDIIPLPF